MGPSVKFVPAIKDAIKKMGVNFVSEKNHIQGGGGRGGFGKRPYFFVLFLHSSLNTICPACLEILWGKLICLCNLFWLPLTTLRPLSVPFLFRTSGQAVTVKLARLTTLRPPQNRFGIMDVILVRNIFQFWQPRTLPKLLYGAKTW